MTFIVPFCEEDLQIIHQDPTFIIVNKPAGLLTVPGRAPQNRDSLIVRIQAQFSEAQVVHRLDMHTSGIVLIPLGKTALSHIARQFQERHTQKTYEAFLTGRLDATHGMIDLPLICDWPNRPLQKVCHEHGKPAQTRFERIHYDATRDASRVRLFPITGRSHQLRVHCQSLGHPIIGDEFYAPEAAAKAADRLLLHATSLGFRHPSTNQWLEFHSPCPF